MLIAGSGLLISLPAEEMRGFSPPASLFEPCKLSAHPMTEEVRWVLQAATRICAEKNLRAIVVARPEIFTHGESLKWLERRLTGTKDHLCVSDGTAVRPIHGMRNHLFLYRQSSYLQSASFKRLIGWVPEILDSLQSQINSCVSVRCGSRTISPPSQLLQADAPGIITARFQDLRQHRDLNVSIKRTRDALLRRLPTRLRHLVYIPLTETACHDSDFMRSVVALIRGAQRASAFGVVLRLPTSTEGEALASRLYTAIDSLRVAGLTAPVRSNSVVLATSDLVPSQLKAPECVVDLLAHTSYQFWQHPKEYFSGFRNLEFLSVGMARERNKWQALLKEAAGRLQ